MLWLIRKREHRPFGQGSDATDEMRLTTHGRNAADVESRIDLVGAYFFNPADTVRFAPSRHEGLESELPAFLARS